jgi:Fe-S-cluster containining protein
VDCTLCGACCVAPDIAALDKPLGVRCVHLGPDERCTRYETRPKTCRDYQPDVLCEQIAAPTLDERVKKYLAHFGLEDEARRVREHGDRSLQQARAREALFEKARRPLQGP